MPANYVLLERIELNASAASITFSNIPQSGYTDLKVVMSVRTTAATDNTNIRMSFNGSTANFTMRNLVNEGGTPRSYTQAAYGNNATGYSPGANSTASTFGSAEFYFPNYTSSNNKSVSVDGVSEGNVTAGFAWLGANLWSQTSAITSLTFVEDSGDFAANSTFSLYGLAALGTTPVIAPKASGGNVIDFDGTYWIHTFTTTGAFGPQQGLTCDYLVIAGGGGSGGEAGAGGGAGGYRTSVGTQGGGGSAGSALSLAAQSYTVTVGAGGAGGTSTGGSGGGLGANGTDSVLSTITALGGGGGSGYPASGVSIDGLAGGSGGGGGNGGSGSVGLGGAASAPTQGYAGGTGAYTFPNGRGMGGGGGAGSVGANGVTATGTGGNGGSGITSSISGTSVARAGGGGGAGQSVQGTGTAGGGTNSAGTANTGGGGSDNYTFNGGNSGGSGVVIIRYLA